MIIETFPVGPLQCNCTILGDPETGEAIVIDPGDEAIKVLERLSAHGLKPKAILITHTHLDHVGGNHEVREKTGARVMLHEKDLPLYDNLSMQAQMIGLDTPVRGKVDEHIHQGDVIFFGGKGDSIEVLHTPGHTPGSCSFFLGSRNLLFSGDTLFSGSIGRTDLWGGDFDTEIRLIRQRLLPLPDRPASSPAMDRTPRSARRRGSNPFLSLEERGGRRCREARLRDLLGHDPVGEEEDLAIVGGAAGPDHRHRPRGIVVEGLDDRGGQGQDLWLLGETLRTFSWNALTSHPQGSWARASFSGAARPRGCGCCRRGPSHCPP